MALSSTPLHRLPLVDPETGDFTVVLETPKGSRNKYKYDTACGAIRLGASLAEGLSFPYDFGFFPSTVGEDGDPLDVLLLLDEPLPPGCVATARLIGALEIEQKDKGGPWERNDRLLAVATHAHLHETVRGLHDLRPHMLPEIEAFFTHYAGMNGKKLRLLGRCGPRRAAKLLKTGARAFKAKRHAKAR
jgi:inorganic pyrophosphatase